MALQSKVQVLDILQSNPAWPELADIMSKVNDSTVLAQVEALLNIRNVTDQTDVSMIERSIRMAGVNISAGLLRSQAVRLGAAFDSIVGYRDVVDSEYWDRYCAFLLDDVFKSSRLWTADYGTFHRDPQGTKVIDGGKWYKTTHVELEVGSSAIDAGFELIVDHNSIPSIIKLLTESGLMDETAATDWANAHFGLTVPNDNATQRLVRNYLFTSKLTEFYYQWAPIEDVLERIVITTQAQAYLSYGVRAVVEPFVYNTVGRPVVSKSEFAYSTTTVRPNAEFTFHYHTVYEDGSEETVAATIDPHEKIDTHGEGFCTFKVPDFREVVQVTLRSGKDSVQLNLTLESNVNVIDPATLAVYGAAQVYAGQRVPFQAFATYAQGGTINVTDDSGYLTWETDLGTFDGSVLVLSDSLVDQVANVKCTYNGVARTLTATAQVNVIRSLARRVPIKLQIEAPDTCKQGQSIELRALATYNDGTTDYVTPIWYSTSKHTEIDDNMLVSGVYSSDYVSSIIAYYADASDTVQDQKYINFPAKNWVATDLRVRIPDRLVENEEYFPEAQAYIVDGDASPEQIASGALDYVRGWRTVRDAHWFGVSVNGSAPMPRVNAKTGSFVAPNVGADTEFGIGFNATVYGVQVSTQKKVTVYDLVLFVRHMETLVVGQLQSNSSAVLRSFGTWSNGASTELNATYTLTFIPSVGTADAVSALIKEEIEARIAAGQSTDGLDPNNPDYSKYVALELVDLSTTASDPYKGETFLRKGIYYSSLYAGTAEVKASYEINGVQVSDVRLVTLSPTRKLVTDYAIEVPDVVSERSRTFVRSQVTYSNGETEYVNSEWSADWYGAEDDPALFAFSSRAWSGLELCEVLSNVVPTSFEEFLTLAASRLSVFAGCTTLAHVTAVSAVGAIMQIESIEQSFVAAVRARYYNNAEAKDVTVTAAVPEPINTIVESRILGPVEISADYQYASYAMVNTYAMSGTRTLADGSEFSTGAYTYEMEVSSDWVIVEQGIADGESYVIADSAIVTVDGDGYVTPLQNVTGYFVLRAVFDDGYNKFSRDVKVFMTKANTYLTDLQILGPTTVHDDPALNPTVAYSDGVWFIPYGLRVVTADGQVLDLKPEDAEWDLDRPASVNGINLDASRARLYVTEQNSDVKVTLVATYTAQIPSGEYETIVGRLTTSVSSARAITDAYIDFGAANIAPNTDVPLLMVYSRRNQVMASSAAPDSPNVKFAWSIRTADKGVTLSDSGVLRFLPSDIAQTANVQCVLTEDRTVITEAMIVTCPGVGYPTTLSVSGHSRVRDDSMLTFTASVERSQRDATNETHNCLWSLQNSKGQTIEPAGFTLNPTTGVLTIGILAQDTEVVVHCLFIEGKFRKIATHVLNVISSIPRYGVGLFGINTLSEVEANLTGRLNSVVGGSFILNAREGNYGYFCCRADYGDAVIKDTVLPNGALNNSYGGWDGAKWTLSDSSATGPLLIQKEYDNLTDTLALYRSNNRAGLLAKFTVSYS